jgi:hypothetical protein
VSGHLRRISSEPSAVDPAARDGAPMRMAELTVVAHTDYLSLARMSAMQVAALVGLPLPRVADLKLAVDEACTSFFPREAPGREPEPAELTGARLHLCYDRYPGSLHVVVRGPAPPLWPVQSELGWELLRAVVGEVRAEVVDGIGILTLIEPLRSAPMHVGRGV